MEQEVFNSKIYWESRYVANGTSGAGSFGRLANFKAEFINAFVAANSIESVIEFGTGNGVQLKLYNLPSYIGVDVSLKAIEDSRAVFSSFSHYSFLLATELSAAKECDLSLSLDVIYHLVEDGVFEKHLQDLFYFGSKYVIVYSSDFDRAWNAQHVRHRNFTRFVATRFPEWRQVARVGNVYPFDSQNPNETSFCDFFIYSKIDSLCTILIPPALKAIPSPDLP